MTADLSRIRFDPLRDHAGVGIQQGHMWLDADFNEHVAIVYRRDRAQVVDLTPAPTIISRETSDAFHIAMSGTTMTIGAGRMYVDGLLAENHGATIGFDPVLAESNGTDPIDYTKQPYRIGLTPPTIGDKQCLVYLDVWERELDHLNTPDLVEPAVGVETTTRTQIVWQVRVLSDVGTGLDCDSTIADYDTLTAPSSARLTTGTVDVDPSLDSCDIPPGKGYRGWENATFRVELHSPTQFKWSNTNASVASAVTSVVSASKLQLTTLGRDNVLAIKSGDWVEVLDDQRELEGEAGEMRQVTVEDGNIITFTPGLPNDLATSTAHLRVRKWNSGLVTIPTDGSAVTLEHGVTVTFTFAATGAPRFGDYWVFAARVAGAWIEPLVVAPPRGIHHHYARLALVSTASAPTDCRPQWPAGDDGCGCEVCVSPDGQRSGKGTIQAAIDQLVERGGGTLTLCAGKYQLDEPVTISGAASVRIRGAGRDSLLVAPKTAAIVVLQSRDVILEGFAVNTTGDEPAILLAGANQQIRLRELRIDHRSGVGVGLAGAQSLVTLADCVISSVIGVGVVGSVGPTRLATLGRLAEREKPGLLTLGLTIADNWLTCRDRGVDLGIDGGVVVEHAGQTSIYGNHIGQSVHGGIVATGLVPRDMPVFEGTLEIRDNLVEAAGPGIVTGGRVRVEDNTVYATVRTSGAHGIALIAAPPDTPDGIAAVLANTVTGCGGYGVSVAAPTRALLVKQNLIRATAGGIIVQPLSSGGTTAVDNNQVLDLAPVGGPNEAAARSPADQLLARSAAKPDVAGAALAAGLAHAAGFAPGSAPPADPCPDPSRASGPGPYLTPAASGTWWRIAILMGIGVIGIDHLTIACNTVDGVGADVIDGGPALIRYGIIAGVGIDIRIAGNTVARVGATSTAFVPAYGIVGAGWQETINLGDNIVYGGTGQAVVERTAWTAIWLVSTTAQKVAGTRTVGVASNYYTFIDGAMYQFADPAGHVELVGNTTHGGGDDHVVVVEAPGDVVMTGNRFAQPLGSRREVVGLSAHAAVVQANRVFGGMPSMTIKAGPAVVLGNITSGGIQLNGATVPADTTNPIG